MGLNKKIINKYNLVLDSFTHIYRGKNNRGNDIYIYYDGTFAISYESVIYAYLPKKNQRWIKYHHDSIWAPYDRSYLHKELSKIALKKEMQKLIDN